MSMVGLGGYVHVNGLYGFYCVREEVESSLTPYELKLLKFHHRDSNAVYYTATFLGLWIMYRKLNDPR